MPAEHRHDPARAAVPPYYPDTPVVRRDICGRMVSGIDFGPTVLSLAGVKVPTHMQGWPFLGDQAGEPRRYIFAARDRIDETYDIIRCVRDSRYKYIRPVGLFFAPEKPKEEPAMGMPAGGVILTAARPTHRSSALNGAVIIQTATIQVFIGIAIPDAPPVASGVA